MSVKKKYIPMLPLQAAEVMPKLLSGCSNYSATRCSSGDARLEICGTFPEKEPEYMQYTFCYNICPVSCMFI